MRFSHLLLAVVAILACNRMPTTDAGKRFTDSSLRIVNAIDHSSNNGAWFSDMGAEIGFKLRQPPRIGFRGSRLATKEPEDALSTDISFRLEIDGIDRSRDAQIEQYAEPGMLVQRLTWPEFYVELRLFFMSSDIALIDMNAQNITNRRLTVDFIWPTASGFTVDSLIHYPPTKNTLHDTNFTPQRINFLSYEHRILQWIIQDEADDIFHAAEPHRPLAGSNSFNDNCTVWRKRTALLAQVQQKRLATQCLQLFYGQQTPNHALLDSLIMGYPHTRLPTDGVFSLVNNAELTALSRNHETAQKRLLKDPSLVENVLASVLFPDSAS